MTKRFIIIIVICLFAGCTDSLYGPKISVIIDGVTLSSGGTYHLGTLAANEEIEFALVIENAGNSSLFLIGESAIAFSGDHASYFQIDGVVPREIEIATQIDVIVTCLPTEATTNLSSTMSIESNGEQNYFQLSFEGAVSGFDTPPVPGDNGDITAETTAETYIDVNWTAATDDTSEQTALEYLLVFSELNNIDTVSEALNNGVRVGGWDADKTFERISNLLAGTEYFVNVVVRDEAVNYAVSTLR